MPPRTLLSVSLSHTHRDTQRHTIKGILGNKKKEELSLRGIWGIKENTRGIWGNTGKNAGLEVGLFVLFVCNFFLPVYEFSSFVFVAA